MADEGNDKTSKTAPPEAPPPIITTQMRTREGRQWLMLFIYLLIALVVAGAVVFGGRWAYDKVSDNQPAQETASNEGAASSQRSTSSGEQAAPQPPGASNGQSSGSEESSNEEQSGTNGQNDELADTGPGEVVGIFLTVVGAAGVIHFTYRLRRQSL